MPTQVIPRPSTLYETKPAKDVDSRLMAARYAVAGDTEDEAAGYAATPGLEDKVRRLEAEYRQTYCIDPPESVSLMAILRGKHLSCSKST
jgi:hypothetical protein